MRRRHRQLSLIIGDRGNRFIFSYPNGLRGEYSLKVNFNKKRRQISAKPYQWVNQPSGAGIVGFEGIVSEKVDAIDRTVRSCGKLGLKRVSDERAPTRSSRSISKGPGRTQHPQAREGRDKLLQLTLGGCLERQGREASMASK